MREYNLFIMKKEYYDLYHHKPEELYRIFHKLYFLNMNFNYGITLYEQLCKRVSIDAIAYYLNNRYQTSYKNIFPFKNAYIFLKPTRIVVKSNYNLPHLLHIFYRYNPYIFVCDFKNNDYFFLNTFIHNKVLQTI